MSVIKISVLVILVVAAAIAYRAFNVSSAPAGMATESIAQPDPAPEVMPANQVTERRVIPNADAVVEAPPACLTVDELNRHPLILKLQSQADAAATNGIDIEKFRGIDDASVRGYADQGDAAAMAVVGAMSVMRAYKVDTTRAVDWLANGGAMDGVVMEQQQMSSDAGLALNDAAYWFYQAALNGKVMALRHYGQVRGQLFGGPVGLGWIEQQDYDALDREQQLELSPGNIYSNVAMEMNPPAGPGAIPYALLTESGPEMAKQIRSDIQNEFNTAIIDAGLTSPTTPAADIAAYERLRSRLCTPERSAR